jgi:hypothetical protein
MQIAEPQHVRQLLQHPRLHVSWQLQHHTTTKHNRNQETPTVTGVAAVTSARQQHLPLLLLLTAPAPAWGCLVLGLLDTAHLPEAVLLLLELLTAPLNLLGQTLADQPAHTNSSSSTTAAADTAGTVSHKKETHSKTVPR